MKEKTHYTILAAVLIAVLLMAGIGYRVLSGQFNQTYTAEITGSAQQTGTETPQADVQQEPVYAPDFIVTDQFGREIHFSALAGKPTILNFWASWCPPCRSELPDFDAASRTYGEEINFLMIDLCDGSRESQSGAEAFVEEQGYTFPVYFDTTGYASAEYSVYSIPVTVGIDASGEIIAIYTGAISHTQLQNLVDSLLS